MDPRPQGAIGYARRGVKLALRRTYPYSLAFLTDRPELPYLLNSRGLLGTGVEVGVWTGRFSELILERWRGSRLISVDAWNEGVDDWLDQATHERRFAEATQRLRPFGERSEIWRTTSADAAARVEPDSLDFVYVDARHDYDSVRADIDAWHDRVRPGGVLCGHDYGLEGVRAAVDEFCAARGLGAWSTWFGDHLHRSWLVVLPADPDRPRSTPSRARVGRRVQEADKLARRCAEPAHRVAKAALRRTYPHTLGTLSVRRELPHLFNSRGLLGTGAEVGVAWGEYSEQILRSWQGRRLISVDPWSSESDDFEQQAEHDRRFAEATERLAAFGERSEIWRMTSVEAAERIERHSLDFVYIDARHDYDSVRADIEAWHDRVRPGGILCGHDYWDGPWIGGVYGVKSAVNEFCAARGLRVHTTRREPPQGRSWLVEMP